MTNKRNEDSDDKGNADSLVLTTMVLASVVHELQSGLQGILTRAEILEDALSQPGTPDRDLQRESTELVRMIRIVTQSLSNFAPRSLLPDKAQLVDLDKIVREAIQLCEPMAKQKGLSIAYRSDTKSKALVQATTASLQSVFYNLLDNAIRYSFSASSTNEQSRIEVVLADTGSGGKSVAISNRGIGLDPEEKQRLFRGLPSRSKGSHVGFGLLIARSIVLSYGGEVSIESNQGQEGSVYVTARVSFPAGGLSDTV
jgi:signal transduction histidine kinase